MSGHIFNFVLQAIPALDLCLVVVTGVMEGCLFNLSGCVFFNITLDFFLRSIFHIPVEEYRGPFIWGTICLL